LSRVTLVTALVLGTVCLANAQENTAAACSNGADDDRDGAPDCSDLECRFFVFCAQAQPQQQMMVHQQQRMMPQQPATNAPGYEGSYGRAREAWYRQNYGYVPQGGYGQQPGYGMQPGYGQQPGYGTHPAWLTFGLGLATFAAGYIGTFVMPLALGGKGAAVGLGFVPLAGPFIELAYISGVLGVSLLVTFGTMQLTGLLCMILGLVIEEPNGPMPFAMMPWVTPDGAGGVVGGSF